MTAYNNLVSDSDGYGMLNDVVFHHRHGPEQLLVPPRVPIDTVDRFLKDKLKPGLDHEQVDRAGDVARFYHRTDAVPLFLAFLTRKEKTAENVLISISALRAIGNLGADDQQKDAADYYAYLLAHPMFEQTAPMMLELVFHLSAVPAKTVTDAFDTRLTRFAAADKNAKTPSPAYAAAIRQAKAVLPATLAARALKDKILAIKDPASQAKPVARLYLGLDSTGVADWPKWSAFQLMNIVLLAGPLAPPPAPAPAAPVNAALNAALAAIPPTDPSEYRSSAAGRGLKALAFFNADLTPQQQEALRHDQTRRFQLQA